MASNVPQAVQSCHELLLWLVPQLDKLPRARRFTLGERIEAGLIEVLELLVEASYTHNKESPLRRANLRLEVARHPVAFRYNGGALLKRDSRCRVVLE